MRTNVGLYAWGGNIYGQVGNGTTTDVLTPVRIDEQNGKKIIEGNIQEIIPHVGKVYVRTDTGLYGWGDNLLGYSQLTPVRIDKQNGKKIIEGNIQKIIAGSTDYVRTDKGLYAWGDNSHGEVGNGTTTNVLTPIKIDEQNGKKIIEGNIKEIINDINTTYVITDIGLYAWGDNSHGEVGNGTTSDVLSPVRIDEQNGKKIIEGNIQEVIYSKGNIYVRTDTGLYAWGDNSHGEVGNGTTTDVLTPVRIDEQNGKKIIEGNIQKIIPNSGTVYVKTDTCLYAWGDNPFGQVGNGIIEDVLTPVRIDEQNGKKIIEGNIKEIIPNIDTIYVRTDVGLYAWGENIYGQVGNGTTDSVLTPVKVVEGDIQGIVIEGNTHKIILTSYARTIYVITNTGLYVWGQNYNGQVGNGTTMDILIPYKVKL